VRCGDGAEFLPSFGEGDIKPALSPRGTSQKKLQRECGFASARVAHDEVEAVPRYSAAKDGIQACDSSGTDDCGGRVGRRHSIGEEWKLGGIPVQPNRCSWLGRAVGSGYGAPARTWRHAIIAFGGFDVLGQGPRGEQYAPLNRTGRTQEPPAPVGFGQPPKMAAVILPVHDDPAALGRPGFMGFRRGEKGTIHSLFTLRQPAARLTAGNRQVFSVTRGQSPGVPHA
jgi:hypothetical protein